MKSNKKYIVLGILMLAATIAEAKIPVKKSLKPKPNFTIIEAYTQRTLPGIPGAQPVTDYHFVIRWESASAPETFFWRGQDGFLICNLEKARKVTRGDRRNIPDGIEYTTEFVTGDDVHRGDTLMLTSMKGGKYPVPKEVSKTAKNTIFYKTTGSKWLSFPIKNIGTKQDIAMP